MTVTASYTDGFGRRESVTSAPTRAVSPLIAARSSLTLSSSADSLAPTLATPGGLLDLRGQSSSTLTLRFQMTQASTFNNTVGFYRVEDTQGRVRDPLTGTLIQPGGAGYLQAALANRAVGDLVGRNDRTTTVTATLATNQLLSTFLVVGGPVSALLDTNPGNDPRVFFNHVAANGDRQSHVRLLGQNTLGYEDTWGGGDRDFNDVIVRTTVA